MSAMKTSLALTLVVLCSCGPLTADEAQLLGTGTVQSPAVEADAGTVADAGVSAPVDGGAELTGLPCDVKAALERNCSGCHAGQTYAPEFLSRADLLRPSGVQGMTLGAYASARMTPGAKSPMPPVGSM